MAAGMQPAPLPEQTTVGSEGWHDGMSFFYQHLGKLLNAKAGLPGNTEKLSPSDKCNVCGSQEQLSRAGGGYTTLCYRCYTFAGIYKGIRRPGRMGAGWMGLITSNGSRLVTSVDYAANEIPFLGIPGVDIRAGKAELGRFQHEVLTNPPEPPYLYFIGANSSVTVSQSLFVSWSNSRAWICSNETFCCNLVAIKNALDIWRSASIPIAAAVKGARTRQQAESALNENVRSRNASDWDALRAKHDGLGPLVEALPPPYTREFDQFAYLARWEEANV